ncbi:hypothetical protein JCM5353_007838 [Sporobolomyces roseus]
MGSGSSTPGLATPRSEFTHFKSTQDEDESLATIASMLAEDLKRLEDRDYATRIQQGRDLNVGDEDERFAFEEDEEIGGTNTNEIVLLRQQLDTVNSKLSRDRRARRKTEGVGSHSICARRVSQQEQHGVSEANDDDFDFKIRERPHDKVARDKRQAMADVEAMLGKDMAMSMYGVSGNPGGVIQGTKKGKRKANFDDGDDDVIIVKRPPPPPPAPVLPDCQICFEPCRPVSNPFKVSTRAGTSEQAVVGMYLGRREDEHLACIGCLTAYIKTKVSDKSIKAFPMSCFQCTYEITDEDATRIFGPENLEGWHFRKLEDSQPAIFCPNPSCSAQFVRDCDMEGQAQASCPACHKMICVDCGVVWHSGYTCDQFQSLPVDEREPEDFALFALARDQKWRRCPGCQVMLGRTHGCNHMSCRCGYRCGSLWVRPRPGANGKCSRVPSCALFEVENLLAPNGGELVAPPPGQGQAALPQMPQPFGVFQPLVNFVARPFGAPLDPIDERRQAFSFLLGESRQ